MPTKEPTPSAAIPPELILAALERAERHRGSDHHDGVLLGTVKEHLGLPHHSGTTRRMRPQLEELQANELIEQFRRHGCDVWALTRGGQLLLQTIRETIPPLPEAPQHREWREAREAASERIVGFRGELRGALDEAIALLEADHEADSPTWFGLSECLQQGARKLASAIHCLREWPEPDDSHADVDDAPYKQRGRRSIRGWDSEFLF